MASPNTTAEDDNLNDGSGTAADNSILAKVKSTVKGIFPNTLSKWFSPGPQNPNSLNDSLNGSLTENISKRRRRIEVDDADEEEEEEEEEKVTYSRRDLNINDEHSDSENESENGDNAEGTNNNQSGPSNLVIRGRRGINQQSKRRRMDSNEEDLSIIPRTPLTASTPAGNSSKARRTHLSRNQNTRSEINHYRHLNLKKSYQNEAGYNFSGMVEGVHGSTSPVAKSIFGGAANASESLRAPIDLSEYVSPRRVLNLPSTSSSLHRAALSTAYNDLPSTSNNAAFLKNTFGGDSGSGSGGSGNGSCSGNANGSASGGVSTPAKSIRNSLLRSIADEEDDTLVVTTNNNKYNGNANLAKRIKMVNGSGLSHISEEKNVNLVGIGESAGGGQASNTNETPSEYSDGGRSSNLAKSNISRHSSRNSLFNATGINFNAHLEGRKSLFSTSQLNKNSTMSLNTIHQNNFNRSMFGSSSALSDSRLMKKLSSSSRSSPKITTMYGGANANIKFLDSGAGAGCSNILPTQMRPTSSLPSLNSTNTMAFRGSLGSATPHISNATKDILDIMNNITTPLGEAKKMGSSFMRTPPSHRNRLSDADLHQSRLLRLERVRTPYGRPLKPTDRNKNLSITELSGAAPPVRELSIPTKAHLMKIKKLQSSTVELRQIALESDADNVFSNEYSLPIHDDIDSNQPPKQTKRKLKTSIKVKSANNNNILEEQSIPPVNLPTVTFPTLTSIPKIDIEIPKSRVSTFTSTSTSLTPTSLQNTITNSIASTTRASTSQSTTTTTTILSSKPLFQFNSTNCTLSVPAAIETSPNTNGLKENIKFSLPIRVKMNSKDEGITSPIVQIKFSKPLRACISTLSDSSNSSAVPKLKTGSCLEAFGDKFKKPSGDWECNTCLVRNKSDAVKCIACETAKSGITATTATTTSTMNPQIKQNFGDSFKIKPNTWDCPTCLINNKCDQNSCVACDTKKPGSTDNTSKAEETKQNYTFGFQTAATSSVTATQVPISQDTEFKKIAASQKSSSWECEACLTRNDAARKKCICCEQAKPGTYLSETETTPSFKFGANAAAKFSFGFPTSTAVNTSTMNNSSVSSSTNVEKTENSPKKSAASSFTFGAVSSTSGGSQGGFSFGIKTATESTNKDKETSLNKAVTDENKAAAAAGTSGFGGFKFGNTITDNVSSSTTTTTSAISTLTSSASGGFSFGIKTTSNLPSTDEDKEIKSSNEPKLKEPEKPIGGGAFSFANPAAPNIEKNTSNTSDSIKTPSVVNISSSSTNAAPTTTTTTSGTITTSSENSTGIIAFGANTAATANFSFGSSLTNPNTIAVTSSNPAPITSNLFAKTTTTTSLFGVNTTTVPSTTKTETSKVTTEPVFGFLGGGGATGNTANIFGNVTTKVAEMPTNTTTTIAAPIFGSTNTGTVTTTSAGTPFMFGTAGSSTTASTFTTTNPTNSSFVFGKAPVATTTEAPKSSIFGGFATASNNNSTNASDSTTTSSLFGVAATQKPAPAFGTSLFNNNGGTNNGTSTTSNIFSTGGTAAAAPNSSVVGQQNPPAFGATPTFGLGSATGSPMGANTGFGNSMTNTFGGNTTATPTFGGNTSATPTFGSFGSSDTSGKKPEAFKFGDPGNVATTNLFSFGGTSNNSGANTNAFPKPAFNFGASNTTPQTFSFGASGSTAPTPTATGGAETPTPNAPFQFNAAGNAAPATNIFAPLPSGPQSPGQQAPRRKIRMAGRRINPR